MTQAWKYGILHEKELDVQDEAGLPAPTTNADSPPPHIFDLPSDMIGKILSRITDEERWAFSQRQEQRG